jgi:hypothetical protein
MKLYPRLLGRFAQDIFIQQGELSFAEIEGATSHPLVIWPATGADRVGDHELGELRAKVLKVAIEYGYPNALSRAEQVALDIAVARVLVDETALSPAEAGFGDVWSFIALVLVPELVWWRAAGSTNIERFVGLDLTRHTLARLWWRGHLFTWDLEDPQTGWQLWADSPIGEAELDQIQTRRGGYGRSPKAFRSLVAVYPEVVRLADSVGVQRREFWRAAYLRRILRLGAFIDLTGLPEADLHHDLLALAREVSETVESAPEPADLDAELAEKSSSDAPDEFDALPFSLLIVRLTEAVRASGEVFNEELGAALERTSGLVVPTSRRELLGGIAWQGKALKYLREEKIGGRTVWRPGSTLPAPDRRWGDWSMTTFKTHVERVNGQDEDVLCSELFTGRAGRTVKRIVRAAIRETS